VANRKTVWSNYTAEKDTRALGQAAPGGLISANSSAVLDVCGVVAVSIFANK
jgi:hypothetical protein